MCGLAGFYGGGYSGESLDKMSHVLMHRGPDNHGIYMDEEAEVGLAHRRLSVIDLSDAASQPFQFANLVLMLNGEIYNFREIRKKLESAGYRFETESDTEVLIKAFHRWREESVDQLIGMFVFVVYDSDTHELFLFRDRMGVKPLYYSTTRGLIFASELRAIRQAMGPLTPDPGAVFHYFRFGFVPQGSSIHKEVKKLPPGSYLKCAGGKVTIHEYWKVRIESNPDTRKENEWCDELEQLLIDSFRYRMVSDVPVGVFLSGGIDSSLVAAILQKHFGTISTLTIGFGEERFNEAPYALAIARALGTDHHEQILRKEDARTELTRFYDIFDEPFADSSGIPVSLVSAMAKRQGIKVVLSADGGDELFGGYPHYISVSGLYRKLSAVPAWMRKGAAAISRTFLPAKLRAGVKASNFEHRLYALEELLQSPKAVDFYESRISNQTRSEIGRLMGNANAPAETRAQSRDALTSFMDWDLHNYLPEDLLVKVDRATMYHSIEGREPYLDHRLVEFAARLPLSLKFRKGQGKYLLRKILGRYLPDELFNRPKQGFSIPIFDWFSTDLDSLFTEHLTEERLRTTGLLDPKEVARELEKYHFYKQKGKDHNIEKMWRILSFMMWHQKHG